mgnify:CR=1 FL=1
MGSFSVVHWLIVCVFMSAFTVVPLWRICSRAGFHGALALLAVIRWLGLCIVGGILSFSSWAAKKQSS